MKTTRVAPAGLLLMVLGCGGGKLAGDNFGTAGATGSSGGSTEPALTGSAGTTVAREDYCGGANGAAGTPGAGGIGGTSGMADPPGSCGSVTTLAECDARTDCHPVFVDPQTCNCAALGCCAVFSRCAVGERATCIGAAACSAVPTRPHCEGPYVVGFVDIGVDVGFGNGYEGCVRASDCEIPTGAAGTNGAAGTDGAAGTNGSAGTSGTGGGTAAASN